MPGMEAGQVNCAQCGAGLASESRFCGECGASAPEADPSGTRQIGRFLLGPIIGHGGMGVVHRARDTDLGRDVALKLIVPSLAGDPDFRARFEAEARAAAAVDHPNVLPVFEAGEDEGELYLGMRLVAGTDPKAGFARESRLPPGKAAQVVAQIAAALDAAHARDLVHRDVKPANALISLAAGGESHVYLTDFGLTQIAGGDHLPSRGQVVGTANYIAPEQIDGRALDGRVDVYALACVAFESLTGEPPFARATAAATLAAHLHDQIPSASGRVPSLPREVDDALAGGLAKSRARRFASCGAFARALGLALGTNTGEIPSDPRVAARARPRRPAAAPSSTPGPAEAPTAVIGQPPPARARSGGRVLVALLALVAGGAPSGAAVLRLPSLLDDRDGGTGLEATLQVLSGAQVVNASLSTLMSRLARDPTGEAERESQASRMPALRAAVGALLAAARRSADPKIKPRFVRALTGQGRLLDQYGRVLNAPPASAQPLIDGVLATLGRIEADLRAAQ